MSYRVAEKALEVAIRDLSRYGDSSSSFLVLSGIWRSLSFGAFPFDATVRKPPERDYRLSHPTKIVKIY
jgi:hypothetical protein